MQSIIYRSYLTHSPLQAIERYREVVQEEPTVILCRPDFLLIDVTPEIEKMIIRSRKAAYGLLLLTHQASGVDEINYLGKIELKKNSITPIPKGEDQPKVYIRNAKHEIIKPKVGRPHKENAVICPNCGSTIRDLNDIGFWYGWEKGIIPPYWEELRKYVLERDNYKCAGCDKKFGIEELSAHHIIAKEDGGTDSARNLETRCRKCHADYHPIFGEDNQPIVDA